MAARPRGTDDGIARMLASRGNGEDIDSEISALLNRLHPDSGVAGAGSPLVRLDDAGRGPSRAALTLADRRHDHDLRSELEAMRRRLEQILDSLKRPAEDDPPRPPDLGGLEPPSTGGTRGTVLLVDDDLKARAAAVSALQDAGFRAMVASDARAALVSMARERPDALVVDLALSGTPTPDDLLDIVRSTMEWTEILVLLYTRERVESLRELRVVHAADEYVSKADGPDALATRVASVLELHRRGPEQGADPRAWLATT